MECRSMIEEVAKANGEPIAFQDYLLTSTSNNISALVYGSRYPFDHPRRRFLDSLLSDLFRAIRTGSLVEFVPPFLLKQIKEHEATLDEHVNRDFIDGYLKKINENEADANPNFQQRYLLGNLLSFFIAGSNTVAVTLQWHVLNLADKPDTVQSRIRREIDEVVGTGEAARVGGQEQDALHDGLHLGDVPMEDRKRMCPGEILASVEIFLYLTSLVQKYRILPGGDKIHGLDSIDIPLAELYKHKVRFVPR
ncbi:hypothetical protein MTO96_021835 [Rhipicephalus appendiculatus]